ncbi:acyl-CoA thioesterase II [Albimonas sp. CAU 1670]|uniref:acyl-CoA thioesterase n=1 Tax=Albimonas sp. CAU 1670 TaxID=3032599 RepID=UPI0031F3DBB7
MSEPDPHAIPGPQLVSELIDLLDVERLEMNLFRGQVAEADEDSIRIYGGHVIAQALMAAYKTVEGMACHSLHAYFIHPGDPAIPVIYEVDRARDGRSFATRRVIAVQHGRQIFNLAASFQRPEESWSHQHDAPQTPGPDSGLRSRHEIREEIRRRTGKPETLGPTHIYAIEMREVEPQDLLEPKVLSDFNRLWMKLAAPADQPPEVHQCLLAYASDMNLLSSGTRRHGISWRRGDAMQASLDHAMWFHKPVDFNDWLLYSMDSPFSGGARSFNRGQVFTSSGELVCSVAQEGLMRPMKKKG